MSIPDSIKEKLINDYGISFESERSVSGGSINRAYRIKTDKGNLFLKYNNTAPEDFFRKEAEGLKLFASAATELRIPDVIATSPPSKNSPGFLVIEFIEPGKSGSSKAFGAALANLHQTDADEFGLNTDNYIGSLPQSNKKHTDWATFFSEERINPMLKMAIDSGKMDRGSLKKWSSIAGKLDDLMPDSTPRLIHGDLWGGNYLFDSEGRAVLIDPAVYYGHPEMDLAFSKMFGGFAPEFYKGYESVSSLESGFEERVPLYNLYPLLVHVNLFGGHYTSQANGVLNRFS